MNYEATTLDIIHNERQRCLDILTLTPSEIRLMAGEMTAQEMRTVQAVLDGLKSKIERGR